MRPSGVTPVASTIISPAPEQANWPRCMRCQSVMRPSFAEYWHIGDTTMRFGRLTPPSWIGVKSLGCGNQDSLLGKDLPQRFGERHRARLIAVQAERVGDHRHVLSGEAGDVAFLDHRQRLLHRLRRVLDQAARPVARCHPAVIPLAALRY